MADGRSAEEAVAAAFFDCFLVAFATFDAAEVGKLFATPGVAHRRDGGIVALTEREDVHRYYQAALDRYRVEGCRSLRWRDLDVTAMGAKSLMAAVTWDLLRADDSVLLSWRQSYCLSTAGAAPLIYSSSMHAEP